MVKESAPCGRRGTIRVPTKGVKTVAKEIHTGEGEGRT